MRREEIGARAVRARVVRKARDKLAAQRVGPCALAEAVHVPDFVGEPLQLGEAILVARGEQRQAVHSIRVTQPGGDALARADRFDET